MPAFGVVEGTASTLLCSPLPTATEGAGRSVERPLELTAETLWTEVAGRLRARSTNPPTGRGSARRGASSSRDDTFVARRPEQLHARVDRGAFPRPDPRRRARRDRARASGRALAFATRSRSRRRRRAAGAAAQPRRARSPRRPEPEVHVRPVRDRLVEPLRPRGRARGRRGAGAGVQPALHLRRHRARQDAPPAGDRALRHGARERR